MLASFSTAVASLALSASAPAGQSAPPAWQADYGKALAQTRADDRPLLVVIEAPTTQGHAENSASPAADQPAAASAWKGVDRKLLGAYDLCRVNAGTKYGKAVAEAFDTRDFPYLAIIDKSGAIILHSQSGEAARGELEATLAKYQAGERPVRVTSAKPVVGEPAARGSAAQSRPVEPGVYLEGMPARTTPAYYRGVPGVLRLRQDCPNCRRAY